jgi:hypothetical protein
MRPPAHQPEFSNLLLIMAKTPRPGTVKTRLCPPLTPGLAADLYRAFLRDTLGTACALPGTAVGVVHLPSADDWSLRALLPPGSSSGHRKRVAWNPGSAARSPAPSPPATVASW